MSLSEQIESLRSKLSSLSIVLQAVTEKVGELTQYHDLLGTEVFENLLNFQSMVNQQISSFKRELDDYYSKIDQVRVALVGSTSEVVSEVSVDSVVAEVREDEVTQEVVENTEDIQIKESLPEAE